MYVFRPDEPAPLAVQRPPVEPKSAPSSPRVVNSSASSSLVQPVSILSSATLAAASTAGASRGGKRGVAAADADRPVRLAGADKTPLQHRDPPSRVGKPVLVPRDTDVFPTPEAVLIADAPIGLTLFQRFAKRSFDLASIVVILALFWWAIIAVWIAVRLTTGSPVIYGHKRVGRNGREFNCYKFRSMVPNADAVLANILATDASAREEWARDFKLKNDPRITRVGRFIRKTSLDELPQLWNVLVNDMSVVGPRPVVRKELDVYYLGSSRQAYEVVKPGLTGPWQVSGRNDMNYCERVTLDRKYVASCGIWSDFMIVMRTVGVMFGRKGAY